MNKKTNKKMSEKKRKAIAAVRKSIKIWRKKGNWAKKQDPYAYISTLKLYEALGFDVAACPLCGLFYMYEHENCCKGCPLNTCYGSCCNSNNGKYGRNAYFHPMTWKDMTTMVPRLIHQLEISLRYVIRTWK